MASRRILMQPILDWARGLCLVLMFCTFFVDVPAGAAQQISAGEAQHRIELALRQQMLSQRVAANTCLRMANIDVDGSRARVALDASDLFDDTLKSLRDGNSEMALSAEPGQATQDRLDAVATVWASMAPAVQQLIAFDLHSVVVSQMMDGTQALLSASHDVVLEMERAYDPGGADPARATTIKSAAQQHMLSQKMLKLACMIALDLEATGNTDALNAAMASFQRTLMQLREGDAAQDILPPDNLGLARQLDRIQSLWEPYQTGLSVIQTGSGDNRMILFSLIAQSDVLLAETSAAAKMYAAWQGG